MMPGPMIVGGVVVMGAWLALVWRIGCAGVTHD